MASAWRTVTWLDTCMEDDIDASADSFRHDSVRSFDAPARESCNIAMESESRPALTGSELSVISPEFPDTPPEGSRFVLAQRDSRC